MEHQYPGAISGDENMLAELMLPDQAHMRKEDWTIFFLHKDTSEVSSHESTARPQSKGLEATRKDQIQTSETDQRTGEDNEMETHPGMNADLEEELEGGEGPPLIYVLNLVNTKTDNTAKRSAPFVALQSHLANPRFSTGAPL